jgi:uncharacterized protein
MENVQPAVAASSAASDFINRVYIWMGGALALTAGAAWYVYNTPAVYERIAGSYLFMILLIAEVGLVLWLSTMVNRMSATTATAAFVVYALLNGITMSVILAVYTQASIAGTFLVTGGTFIATAWYGYVTKRDLSAFGSFMVMSLIGLILASVVNLFLRNEAIYWVLTYLGVIVFVGLTAYDMQKIKQLSGVSMDGETAQKSAIMAALTLYLDFINLFLHLLRIFGKRK